jgi:PTS system galactitol-specific IIA component
MISPALSMPRLAAPNSDAVITALATRLVEQGHARPTFVAAALAREKRSPTALPFSPNPVALPHAEPEHVVTPAIAIATLAAPVKFRHMGSPGVSLPVTLVVMPALSAKEQAAASLSRIIELLQDEAFRADLLALDEPNAMAAAFEKRWSA